MTEVPDKALEAALDEYARTITEIYDRGKGLIPADRHDAMIAALQAAAPFMDYQAGFDAGGAIAKDLGFAAGIEAAAQLVEETWPGWDATAAAIRALKQPGQT